MNTNVCPKCGKPLDLYRVKRDAWACSYCDYEFSIESLPSPSSSQKQNTERIDANQNNNSDDALPPNIDSSNEQKMSVNKNVMLAFRVAIGALCGLIAYVVITSLLPNTSPSSLPGINIPTPAPTEFVFKPENYRTDITYEQLARTPDKYTGEYIAVSGTVLQVAESGGMVHLRVSSGEWYSDIYYIEYPEDLLSVRVLENDEITIYGEYTGLYEYNSIFGQQVIVPSVSADHIEITNEGE